MQVNITSNTLKWNKKYILQVNHVSVFLVYVKKLSVSN